jgi:hypothetical protein
MYLPDLFVFRCFVTQSIKELNLYSSIEMGPMITDEARQKVLCLVKSALDDGAKVVCGGRAEEGDGYFTQPTILRDVRTDMEVARRVFDTQTCVHLDRKSGSHRLSKKRCQ